MTSVDYMKHLRYSMNIIHTQLYEIYIYYIHCILYTITNKDIRDNNLVEYTGLYNRKKYTLSAGMKLEFVKNLKI